MFPPTNANAATGHSRQFHRGISEIRALFVFISLFKLTERTYVFLSLPAYWFVSAQNATGATRLELLGLALRIGSGVSFQGWVGEAGPVALHTFLC